MKKWMLSCSYHGCCDARTRGVDVVAVAVVVVVVVVVAAAAGGPCSARTCALHAQSHPFLAAPWERIVETMVVRVAAVAHQRPWCH